MRSILSNFENMNSLEQNTDIILVGDFNLKEVDWNRNLMLNTIYS